MQYIKKSKVPLAAWILLIALFVSVIVLVVLHFVGIIDLSFVAVMFLGVFQWAGADIVNAVLVSAGGITLVVLVDYTIRKYFVGQKILTQQIVPPYDPRGTTLSQQPQMPPKDEVVVKA